MKNKKLYCKGNKPARLRFLRGVAAIAALLVPSLAFSQTPQKTVLEEWTSSSGTQNTFQRSIVRSKVIAGNTYYYTAGATVNSSGNYDMLVTKYNSSGTVLWSNTYAGSGNGDDMASDLQIDNIGNVYITGSYYKNPTDSNNAITIKYNSAGTQKWVATYNGAGSRHDASTALIVNGNTIVTVGVAWTGANNKYDMLMIRYDSTGAQQWANTWDYVQMNDVAVNLYLQSGSLYVAGGAQSGTFTYKYAVLKINTANGTVTSSTVTGGSAFGFDKLTDIQQDAIGNIYVTGAVLNMGTGYDYKTVKYDSTLTLLWSASYTGSGSLDDVATGLYVDSLNNVIVTGYTNTTSQGKNYATIKYNSSGAQQWVKTYNGSANKNDSASAIVAKGTDIYVTGASHNGTSYDYYTIKYDASGNKVWDVSWNSPSNKNDFPTAIAVDTKGAVIITGQTKVSGANTYCTIKYANKAVLTPTDNEALNSAFCFTENRGQLLGTDSKPTDIKFYNKTGGNRQQVYFADRYMSYVFAKLDTAQVSPVDSLHRIDMNFNNGLGTHIYARDLRSDYENFFLAHIPDGCLKMKTYNQLYRPEIYTKTDVIYSSNAAGMKYYYVIKPGGNPNLIEEEYVGANSVYLNGNDLVIASDLGDIYHPQAKVWEIDGSGNVITLSWQPSFNVNGNIVSYVMNGSYNTANTLVIEVDNGAATGITNQITGTNMDWSSHYGSLAGGDTPFNSVRADKAGNSFYGGTTNGNNFPFSPGALQTVGGTGGDWTIVKIKTNAIRGWATYYGGTGADGFMNMTIDSTDHIYFCGATGSASLPMAPSQPAGAYVDPTHNGSNDLFVVKMDSTGLNINWSTYYGGSLAERPNGIFVSPSGNYLTIIGIGNANFPLVNRAGAYNSTSGQNFILQFDNLYNTKWGTLFATNGLINDVAGDGSGTLYMVGSNSGANGNLPIFNPGGGAWFDNNAQGDAFIVRFNQQDTVTWCTGFGGSGSDDGYGICITSKDIYVIGHTSSAAATFPLQYQAGQYCDSIINTNNPDGWIARFAVTGVKKWCSLWGGMGMEILYDITADDNDNIYVHGLSDSPTSSLDIYAIGNSYNQGNPYSSRESVIMAFSPQNTRTWSTCFGGNKNETGVSLATSSHSKLFITGNSFSLPATYPWAFPNQVANEWIDTLKTNINQSTGYMARFDITTISVGMSESQNLSNANFIIYPNPTSGSFVVQMDGLKGDDVRITVFDVLGQVIIDRKTVNNFGTLQEQIDLSNVSNGIYMVTVQIGHRVAMTNRVIKQQ